MLMSYGSSHIKLLKQGNVFQKFLIVFFHVLDVHKLQYHKMHIQYVVRTTCIYSCSIKASNLNQLKAIKLFLLLGI